MKKLLIILATSSILLGTAYAGDSKTAEVNHKNHHASQEESTAHNQKVLCQHKQAHIHDHGGDVQAANKHAKEHGNDHVKAHHHDHGQASNAEAHADHHKKDC